MRQILFAIALVASTLLSTSVSAQAWIREPGSVYTQLAYRLISANRLFDADGNIVDIRSYKQHTLGLYAEAGVIDRWLMLTVDGELLRRGVLPEQGAVTGLGDFGVGAWTGLVEKPFRLSFGVHVGIPTGDPDPDAPDPDDSLSQAIADVLPTGDGEVDVSFKLAGGHGFGWLKVQQYVLAEAGYILRTTPRATPGGIDPTDIRDQFSWRAETGIRINRNFIERFWFVLRFTGLHVVQDRNASTAGNRFAGLGDGVEYVSFGIEAAVRIYKGLSFSAGFDGAFFAKNVPAAPSLKFAISYEHKKD